MYNWSTDTKKFKNKEDKVIWEIEQTINFGLGKTKFNKDLVRKHWSKLEIDPARRRFLEYVLWNKKS